MRHLKCVANPITKLLGEQSMLQKEIFQKIIILVNSKLIILWLIKD
jgi:hypothetical protein